MKSNTETYHYTASGRFSLWDSFSEHREAFIQQIDGILQRHAGALLEVEDQELYHSEDSEVVALAAILDKIVGRGNPTLVDLDFEEWLLADCPPITTSDLLGGSNQRRVGRQFVSSSISGNDLLRLSEILLDQPYDRMQVEGRCNKKGNLAQNDPTVSPEEDRFFEAFGEVMGAPLQSCLQRQAPISEITGDEQPELMEAKVDFALQVGGTKWVFEIDGAQHKEEGQAAHDEIREEALKADGWQVFHLSAVKAREQAAGWLQETWQTALSQKELDKLEAFGTIKETRSHPAFEATWKSVVLPHVTHQCLRGLVQLVMLGVLSVRAAERPIKILCLEEDVPALPEAFRQLMALWHHLHVIAPQTPAPPPIELYLWEPKDIPGPNPGNRLTLKVVSEPTGTYDLILSHSFCLSKGEKGELESRLPAHVKGRRAAFRKGYKSDGKRKLPWGPRLTYNLEDLEEALRPQENGAGRGQVPKKKYEALRFFLNHVFRKYDFWDGQARVITRLLQGKASVVLLPTGGGKSLTYQFSGLLLPGVTIVVDPLVALMTDQVDNLNKLAIDQVGFISSQLGVGQREKVLDEVEAGQLSFVFISPERLQMSDFRKRLGTLVNKMPISLAVIDEAHCVSEWGHKFRSSYLHLGRNIKRHCTPEGGEPPTLVGLTGTASFAVLTDMQLELGIKEEEAIILPQSFDREELVFHVEKVSRQKKVSRLKVLKERLPRIFQRNPQTFFETRGRNTNAGIIFCPWVNGKLGVVHIANILGHNNYYSGSKPKRVGGGWHHWREYKREVQRDFKSDQIQELVATKSFGMGIDKPNIRYTIHYGIPQSVEAFYQEAGRAGRDGRRRSAHCFILYSDDNWEEAKRILNTKDHRRAAEMLERVNRQNRGDLLIQLWFLFNTYKDRQEEKEYALAFWQEHLAPTIKGMGEGAQNTVEVPFRKGGGRRSEKEKAIFRLVMLGVVDDYAVDWQKNMFSVRVRNLKPSNVLLELKGYLRRYKFEEFAQEMAEGLPQNSLGEVLKAAINTMVDFVYDEIVPKRKQALRTMAELCRNFESDEQFREAILAYLQDSEFTPTLKTWVNRPFEQVQLEGVYEVLNEVSTLDEAKRLIGTTRRMLDEDPSNLALRYLSACARIRSEAEGEGSVIQETKLLLQKLEDVPTAIQIRVFLKLLDEMAQHRTRALEEQLLQDGMRRIGSAEMARAYLEKRRKWPTKAATRRSLLKLMAARTLQRLGKMQFHKDLPDSKTPIKDH